jgi:DNA-binding NtrC family response regulator
VNAGRFREDLFFRLNVFPITVPPLRERLSDVGLLAEHFLEKLGYSKRTLSNDVLAALHGYHWPGNIRELRNILERATILAGGAKLEVEHLGFLPGLAARRPHSQVETPAAETHAAGLEDSERQMIVKALEASGGNKSLAARQLKITRRVLYTKLRKHGLEG